MSPSPDCQPGLRERKKQATRRALQRAALRLAAERGLGVTVEEICAAVDVSPRTFFNYFSAKEEAIIGEPPAPPPAEQLAVVADGDPDEDPFDAMRLVLREHLAATLPSMQQMRLRKQVLDACPELVPHLMHGFIAIERRLVDVFATRLDQTVLDVDPQVLAATTVGAMRLAVRRWIASGGDPGIEVHVDDVFGALAHLLPTPDPISPRK